MLRCYSTVNGKLTTDLSFVPGDHKTPAGRPAKKRIQLKARKTTIQKNCKACGGNGHFAKRCEAPSTEY